MVLHLHEFDVLHLSKELTGLLGDAHLAAEAAGVVVGHRGAFIGLELHVEALLEEVLCGVHDLDAVEFVVAGKGAETLGTGGNEGVDARLLDLLLVVGLELLKDLGHALPLLVVAAALQEVAAKVGHVLAHLFEEGEGRGGAGAEVHGALVEVAEHHLLVQVIHAAGVEAHVAGDGVVLGGDEVRVGALFGLGVEDGLEHGVGNLGLRAANDEAAADVHVGVVVHELRAGVGAR